ncbi:MAG: hypothetical protein QOI38_2934 [Sphingomonadales bacterium]|nr:hypothetical protein [Sphingomonadales bacterium]
MTEQEELIAALILDTAAELESQRFKGSLSLLRERTEGAYSLDKFRGAFEGAVSFLEDRGIAKLHSYPGVEDYISIDMAQTGRMILHLIAQEEPDGSGFSFRTKNPRYRIINSYLDVGSSWLHDYALTMRDDPKGAPPESIIRSESWTGRYTVSESNKVRVCQILAEMRREIEALQLSNSERANALAAVSAIETLAEAPDPAWALILRILRSPILGNVTALAALVVSIITG